MKFVTVFRMYASCFVYILYFGLAGFLILIYIITKISKRALIGREACLHESMYTWLCDVKIFAFRAEFEYFQGYILGCPISFTFETEIKK